MSEIQMLGDWTEKVKLKIDREGLTPDVLSEIREMAAEFDLTPSEFLQMMEDSRAGASCP